MQESAPAHSRSHAVLPWLAAIVGLLSVNPQSQMNYGTAAILFDYRFGFVKRGLLGVPFSHLQRLTRGEYVLGELALILAAYALTYFVFSKALFRDRGMTPLAVLLLCGPALFSHFSIMFIPTDVVLYSVLLCCTLLVLRQRPLAGLLLTLPLCLTAMLVHEGFSAAFYPALVCIFLEQWRKRELPFAPIVAHFATMVAAFGMILHFGRSKVAPATFLASAQARSALRLDPQLFNLMHQTTLEYSRDSLGFIFNRGTLQMFGLGLLIAAPYFFLLARLLRRVMRDLRYTRLHVATVFILCCGPLVLCLLATDWFRWVSDCCICATVFLLYLYCADGEAGPVRPSLHAFTREANMLAWLGYVIAIGPFGGMFMRVSAAICNGYYYSGS